MAWLRLFAVFTRIGALNELAYRVNFVVQALESVVAASTVLGAVAVVFSQTDRLGDWQAWELVALIGVYFLVLGMINLVLAPSMAKFMEDVQQGTLDFTLTKPEDAQVLVFGHTHMPWMHEFGGVLFLNCGSFGKPKDGDARGAFAVLDLDGAGRVRARIERVPYDAAAVARQVAAAGLPVECAGKLLAAA